MQRLCINVYALLAACVFSSSGVNGQFPKQLCMNVRASAMSDHINRLSVDHMLELKLIKINDHVIAQPDLSLNNVLQLLTFLRDVASFT